MLKKKEKKEDKTVGMAVLEDTLKSIQTKFGEGAIMKNALTPRTNINSEGKIAYHEGFQAWNTIRLKKELFELADTLLSFKTRGEMLDFLYGILTPKELEEIPTRLQIVKMLKKLIPQHEIVEKLGVGIATVTRGSKELQKDRFKYIKP